MNLKKNDNIILTYLVDNKISFFFGKITKIKKFTFNIEKKIQGVKITKRFFIKNPNLVSLKKH